jgi:hypothetical protein
MLRSAPHFAAWCAADPGAMFRGPCSGSRLRGAARRALHRVRDTIASAGRMSEAIDGRHEKKRRHALLRRNHGRRPLRVEEKFCFSFSLFLPVQSPLQKYFASPVGQIISTNSRHPTPPKGRIAIVTDAGCGCGGRGSVLRATGLQGGLRPVSGQQHADERCCQRTAKSCGPDTPTLVSSSRSCVGPTGLRQNISADDGGKTARSPGRARRNPLKPLRAGTSGDSGVLVVTRVRSTTTKCTRGRGCNGHPAFPTPFFWAKDSCKARARKRREIAGLYLRLRQAATRGSRA